MKAGGKGSRLKERGRTLRITSLAAKVGASYGRSLLGRALGLTSDESASIVHQKNAARVLETAIALRGPFMKLVQLIAAQGDALPEEYFDALSTVHDQAPPLPWEKVCPVLAAELRGSPEKVFRSIDPQAIAAASLGQVYSAILPDGTPVAVKVQYPGVREAVQNDLRVFRRLFRAQKVVGADLLRLRGLDYGHVFDDIAARLKEELDYTREAANIDLFRRIYAGWEWVSIPRVYREFSTSRVLTMDLMGGKPLGAVLKSELLYEERERLAVRLSEMLNHEFYGVGIIHGDAHPGNKLIGNDGKIAQLDFGCIKVLSCRHRDAHVASLRAVIAGDDTATLAALRDMGFYREGLDPAPMLTYWKFCCAPLLGDRPATFGAEWMGHLTKLASTGYLHFPADSAFGLRVMLGASGVFKMLHLDRIDVRQDAIDFFENRMAVGQRVRDELERDHLV